MTTTTNAEQLESALSQISRQLFDLGLIVSADPELAEARKHMEKAFVSIYDARNALDAFK